jgi:CHAT domain-containing protein
LLKIKSERTENVHDCDSAVYHLKEAVEFPSAPPTERLDAALQLSSILERAEDWDRLSKITETAVNLLPLVNFRFISQNDQQHNLENYTGLASQAAAAALQVGKSASHAVQLLELGRGVIANLRLEMRSDLISLKELHPQIAKEFEELRDELDVAVGPGEFSMLKDLVQVSSRRQMVNRKLDQTIKKIRTLSGFETFLLPPDKKELQQVAGPSHCVVLINVSTIRCDAFLIRHDSITALNLPDLNKKIAEGLALALKTKALKEDLLLIILYWLWATIVCPVLNELGFQEGSSEQWPRICWVPTGSLCLLPIHAAGDYMGNSASGNTILDRAISSYSPSVKALLYAHRNKASQNQKTRAPLDKALLISMENTPDLAWNSSLPSVTEEIAQVRELLDSSIPVVALREPRKADVLDALSSCKVFHFAGHGMSHPSNPSKSSLLLKDWQENPLTVEDLIARKLYQNPPFLAYLSACSTGDNNATKLLDEGIHLMGACQLAGFQHVIGSLWEVSDKHCVDVAKEVYRTMRDGQMSDESVALGLHNAIRALRDGSGGYGESREMSDKRCIEVINEIHHTMRDSQMSQMSQMSHGSVLQTQILHNAIRMLLDGSSDQDLERNANLVGGERTEITGMGDPLIWAAYIHMGI